MQRKVSVLFTPHVSDVMVVIVLTLSVCVSAVVSIRLTLPAEQRDIWTWHGGQVDLGQVKVIGQRSRSRVTRSLGHSIESLVICLWTCQRTNSGI